MIYGYCTRVGRKLRVGDIIVTKTNTVHYFWTFQQNVQKFPSLSYLFRVKSLK